MTRIKHINQLWSFNMRSYYDIKYCKSGFNLLPQSQSNFPLFAQAAMLLFSVFILIGIRGKDIRFIIGAIR